MAVGIAGELFLIWRSKGRIVLDLAVEGWRESLVSCSGCACLDVLVEGWWRELLASELFALDLAVEGWRRKSLVSCLFLIWRLKDGSGNRWRVVLDLEVEGPDGGGNCR